MQNKLRHVLGALVATTTVTTVAAIAGSASPGASAELAASSVPSWSLNRTISDARIHESSGLARSTYGSSLLWTHNDSGDGARVFAVSAGGRTVSTVTVAGARARDWEDIATGPGHALYIGDIGDNQKQRSNITVYKVTEPSALSATMTVPSTAYTFAYADGHHNAEGLMVRPNGRLYVVTKAPGGGGIYEAPATLSTTHTNVLTRVGTAPAKVTAAAWAPNGSGFTVRNYETIYVYSSIGAAPRVYPSPHFVQAESLEYTGDSASLLLGSEGTLSPVNAMVVPTS